jgi:sRNA-binding carbon storage regulator CsrA
MLVLARRQGESLKIGNDIAIIVKEINPSHVRLCVNDSEDITIDKLKSKVIADGIKITVKKIKGTQARLSVNAPESMKVDREDE